MILIIVIGASVDPKHPVRGLFLRSYLTQVSKEALQLIENKVDTETSTEDAVEFVLQNFTEMNKLWVRMQHQGPVREREAREKERLELRILVGTQLSQLSKLEGVDLAMYESVVLPQVLEQVRDAR